MKLATFIILLDIFQRVDGWLCESPIERVFSRINTDAVLQFSADLTHLNSQRQFSVKTHVESTIATIRYFADKSPSINSIPGVRIEANQSGNILVTLENVQDADSGSYGLSSAGFQTRFSCLYILGQPTMPNIHLTKIPFVGDNVTLSCNSSSTTTPSNHGLSLKYNWKVGGVSNPNGVRYSYSTNRKALTILDVDLKDNQLHLSCSATENVITGYSSKWSAQKTFDVYYGPGEVVIDLQSPVYVTEGNTNKEIHCSAHCNPSCSYEWKNVTSGTAISIDEMLSFKRVTRFIAGNFTCTVKNTEAPNRKYASKGVTIIVKYPPTVLVNLSTTSLVEGDNLTLFCEGVGVPAKVNFISLMQTVNNIHVRSPKVVLSGIHQYKTLYSPLTFQDTGTYTCVLNNGIKDTNGDFNQLGSIDITVKARPKILTNDLRFAGSAKGTTIIKIAIYSFPTVTSVVFQKHNGKFFSSDQQNIFKAIVETLFYGRAVKLNGTIFWLEMRNLTEKDFGNYSLTLTNAIGTTTVNASLVAEGKPLPPTSFAYHPGKDGPTFVWKKNFNGGLVQKFVLQIAIAGSELWTNSSIIYENETTYQINSTFHSIEVEGLKPGIYTARLLSKNEMGESEIVNLGTTFEVIKQTGDSVPITAIVGSCSSILVVFLIGGVGFICYRRRYMDKRAGHSEQSNTQFQGQGDDDDDDDDDDEKSEVNTVNPMYVRADELPDNTYAQPVKSRKPTEENDLHAKVEKKKKRRENPENVKSEKKSEGTNSMKLSQSGKKYVPEENVYENPKESLSTQSNKSVNKDGLIYVDLDFDDKKTEQEKPRIVHLESSTEYVEVDFSKKADPLPESDEENCSSKK